MEAAALEQIADSVPKEVQESGAYNTLEIYTSGLTHMYTGPMRPFDPTIGPIGGPGSPGGVLHKPDYLNGGTERFRQPEWDHLHDNHMNYETLIPGVKKPITNIHIPMDDDKD